MSFSKAARPGLFAILLSLATTTFLASTASAQEQYCECVDNYAAVAVRRAPARRTARKYRKARRSNVVARRTTTVVTQPVYRTAYVPVREAAYAPQYVEYADRDDCDDTYTASSRVVVTEPVYTSRSVVYATGARRKAYYDSPAVYTNTNRVYVSERYGSLPTDSDYYSTVRIASDYGYRDGFSDGREVALEREAYNPAKEGDFRNGTNGYEGDFGSKSLYKRAYRDAYLKGYNTGWRSIAQSDTFSIKY